MEYKNNQNQFFEIIRINENNIYKKLTICKICTLIWVSEGELHLQIDGIFHIISQNSMLCISPNQNIRIDKCAENQFLIQYNQDFYCITRHDKEVSCAGLLFFSPYQNIALQVNEHFRGRLNLLMTIFEEEFTNIDSLEGEMLRILLKRLIIICTRLAKKQLFLEKFDLTELDTFRHFSILVEQHFRTEHGVQFYAEKLNKAAKTLSNQFLMLNLPTPIEIIHKRIVLEAKRFLIYTDLSFSEIALQLGFEELAHFSRFFKKNTTQNPSEFRKNIKL